MKKTIMIFVMILSVLLFTTACSKKNSYINKNAIHEHCTRAGNAGEGIEVELNYEIYYDKKDVLLRVEATEEIITKDKNTLDTYEESYKNIHSYYSGLEYYNTEIKRTYTSVKSTTLIEYDKIDIDKLIEIEGEEDNIFEDKVPKASKWKEFASQFGTTCTKE